MSNPFHDALDENLRGQRVRAVSETGSVYEGIVERVHHHDRDILLRGAEQPNGNVLGPVWVPAAQTVEVLNPERRVETVAVDDVQDGPFAAREFEREENLGYINQVREREFVGSFPVVRERGDGYEVVEGHKRFWVCREAGLDRHPVIVENVDDWGLLQRFVEDHIPESDSNLERVADDDLRDTLNAIREVWGDMALDIGRVETHAYRLGMTRASGNVWSDETVDEVSAQDTDAERGDPSEDQDDLEDEGEPSEDVEPSEESDLGELDTGDHLPDEEQAFILTFGDIVGVPEEGTFHLDDECWVLHRSDSDRDVVAHPQPRDELAGDDDWSVCGHCQRQDPDTDTEDEDSTDETDAEERDDDVEIGTSLDEEDIVEDDVEESDSDTDQTLDGVPVTDRRLDDIAEDLDMSPSKCRAKLVDEDLYSAVHDVTGYRGGAT